MARDYDTRITVGLEADLSGGVQTEKELDKLKKKAKELAKEGESGAGQVTAALGKVSNAAGMLRRVLAGFGVVGAITGLIGAIGRLKESFGAAKKEAEALKAAQDKAAHKEAVGALAKSYKELEEATKRAADAAQHSNEMLDISVKNARDLEDAQLDLAEQRELDAVDGSDPVAQQRRAEISARYSQRRGSLAASRGRENVVYERQRLQGDADAKRKAADDIVQSLAEDDRVISEAERRRSDALTRGDAENDRDATGFWAGFGKNLQDIVSLNWGSVGDARTGAGDAKRAEAKAEAEELEAEIKQLKERKDAKLKEAERLRQEAARAEEKKDALGGQIEVSDVKRAAADIVGRRGSESATLAREKKETEVRREEEQRAADALAISRGKARIGRLEKSKSSEEARAQAAADSFARENEDVFRARNAYDMAVANRGGGSREAKSALAALQKEEAEAREAKAEMERVAARVASTIAGINEQIRALAKAVQGAENRQKNYQAEAAPAD